MKTFKQYLKEQNATKIGIFPSNMKPMHLGHYKTIERASEENDKVFVFISKQDRDGFSVFDTLKIWDLYKPLIKNNNIEVKISDISPVKDTYDIIDNINNSPEASNTIVTIYAGTEDDFISRYANLLKPGNKYTNNLFKLNHGDIVTIPNTHPRLTAGPEGKLSASSIRNAIKNNDDEAVLTAFPPVDSEKLLNILNRG